MTIIMIIMKITVISTIMIKLMIITMIKVMTSINDKKYLLQGFQGCITKFPYICITHITRIATFVNYVTMLLMSMMARVTR